MTFTKFRPRIRSRHPSHLQLRPKYKTLPLFPFKSVIRFGSSKEFTDGRIEVNTVNAIKNSSNKLLMKECFTENTIKTAVWWQYLDDERFANQTNNEEDCIEDLPYPIISKNVYGSRGTGNKKHDNQESLEAWMEGKNLENYIFEKFHNYSREYRLHVTEDGCFYTCRKMLKRDTPDDQKWFRNDNNSVWILEENPLFDKPVNWDEIVSNCVNALKSVGLDFGAVDLKIQSATNVDGEKRENPEFIVIEINSAPSLGEITLEKYIEELPKILNKKNR